MSAKAFVTAKERGRQARRAGEPLTRCPYPDHRTRNGAVTYSRAFITAWRDGWRQEDRALAK